MEDLYECIRIMQISTEKLQSNKHSQSLHRSSLIRSTFLHSKDHFCQVIYSLIKVSPTTNSHKRKSSHVETVKRLRVTTV